MQLPWKKYPKATIGIIGDVILDEYLDGQVSRISPEAPVPVHLVKSKRQVAGGAANVARNIVEVAGQVHLVGVCGDDSAGQELKNTLSENHIAVDAIVECPDRPTVRKTRITAGNHQLVRLDWEDSRDTSQETQDELFKQLTATPLEVLIISDYGKGTLPDSLLAKLCDWAKQNNVKTVVDPKGNDYSKYAGAHLITPNYNEACVALSFSRNKNHTGRELAEAMLAKYAVENVLITLGAQGMCFLSRTGTFLQIPAQSREVFDVSGAGDTVVAVTALGLLAKLDWPDLLHHANLAAGRVVEKWGTQPITETELLQELAERRQISEGSKIFATRQKLADQLETLKRKGKKIVFTNGCFDVIHAGHTSYLQHAKSCGDVLVVAVNSDASVKRLKGDTRPINTSEHRQSVLSALGAVDYVIEFDEDTPLALIKALKPQVLVKGGDWSKDQIVGSDFVEGLGGEVKSLPFVDGLSTTSILNKI